MINDMFATVKVTYKNISNSRKSEFKSSYTKIAYKEIENIVSFYKNNSNKTRHQQYVVVFFSKR